MIFIIAITTHFLFDWIFQPRQIAITKSKKFSSLMKHVLFQIVPYVSIVFLSMAYLYDINILVKLEWWFYLWWVNIISHALIDWYLARIFKPETSHTRLFQMIAVDQMLHLNILLGSIWYLIN